jgi:DNA invertase Pin-like site-specific DNA recombinase
MSKFVAYLRVSTQRQGQSGLGIEAQRERILVFVSGNGEVLAWYEEHESGKKSDRSELAKALDYCEITGATLLVATLDRLTRDVMFLESVKRRCEVAGFDFKCADMPDATPFILGIMGLVAQYERERISERTKAALQAARARGTKLGCPNGARALEPHRSRAAQTAGAGHRKRANEWAEKRRTLVAELVAAGFSNSAMANELNERAIRTRRDGQWTATSVKRLRERLCV